MGTPSIWNGMCVMPIYVLRRIYTTVYPKKYAHGFCFAVLCCGYTLTDFPISIRLTSLALWQSNDCPSASKATLMNMDKYFMWIHYERLHNHNKAKHKKTVCIFLGIYCTYEISVRASESNRGHNQIIELMFHVYTDLSPCGTQTWMLRQCKCKCPCSSCNPCCRMLHWYLWFHVSPWFTVIRSVQKRNIPFSLNVFADTSSVSKWTNVASQTGHGHFCY